MTRALVQQMLEALKYSTPIPQNVIGHEAAILAARDYLEAPDEPVAWIDDGGMLFWRDKPVPDGTDLFTHPAPEAKQPTVPDNLQDWTGMDGAIAWHLIERHADNWADIGKMMNEWLLANTHPSPEVKQEPVRCQHCGTHEVSMTTMCHNSSCTFYGVGVTTYEGWKSPAESGCTRSHPHENMNDVCKLKTEIERLKRDIHYFLYGSPTPPPQPEPVNIDPRWAGIDYDKVNAELRDYRDQIARLREAMPAVQANADGYVPQPKERHAES